MIHSGYTIRSVHRGFWEERSAALLSRIVDADAVRRFDLLEINADSLALVRNMRGCICVGAYVGHGFCEFVEHCLNRGYAVAFFTRHRIQAMRTLAGLYTDVIPDNQISGRYLFFIPARA